MTRETAVRAARATAEGLSLAWALFLAASYAVRAPATAFITVLPPWFWAAGGIGCAVAARSRGRSGRTLLLIGIWIVVLLVVCEEPWAITTAFRPWPDPEWIAARDAGSGLRIVTFNCGDGGRAALREALTYSPDILVLEESPPEKDIRDELATHPEMKLLPGFDVSLIVRGGLEPAASTQARWMFNAAYTTVGEVRVAVVGLRLRVPHFSFSIWDPREWSLAAESQHDHEAELRYVLEQTGSVDRTVPVIIAGDFNAPAGDGVFRLMPDGFRDAFREAGIGLGNTMMNDLPVSRIDQVWLDPRITAHAVVVRKTTSSDHRLVIADVSVP